MVSNEEKLDIDKAVEEVKEKLEEESQLEAPSPKPKRKVGGVILTTAYVLITIIILAFTIFTIMSMDNSKISDGISILGIDVSGLTKQEATSKITTNLNISLSNDITLIHDDYETTISTEQIEVNFDVDGAVDLAFSSGQGSNVILNSFKKLSLIFNPIDITPTVTINEEQLTDTLNSISTQLPDAVVDSSYYIDEDSLILTTGSQGVVIDVDTMKSNIIDAITNLSYVNNKLDIVTIIKDPVLLDIEEVYNEVYKEAKDAYYTTDPYVVYPHEDGLDFAITLDEAKQMLETEQDEYVIPLTTVTPSVTTNMLGLEAFPDLLASYSTKYDTSNTDRTTNLKLASAKINGTVLLPGETFSYNTIVGERTIAAGYKEAAMYQDGQVVNGLGGGICQISTTLYNAALYANMEITERRNHQFVPSYVSAGRDATVVYGSQDFKFTNNRNYAVKIVATVENGVATIQIYGLREENDYEVVISSSITSKTSTYINSVTYKTLKQNGQTVSSEVISRDTYKVQ